MPWRLASKGYNRIKQLKLLDEPGRIYILAGHSLGAKMAAQFVYENPGLINKLILLGTTHPRDIFLAESRIPILKFYGSKDGVADEKSVLLNKAELPPSTSFIRVEGANHSQFGYYGFQLGDHAAAISRQLQQATVLQHMVAFINQKPHP